MTQPAEVTTTETAAVTPPDQQIAGHEADDRTAMLEAAEALLHDGKADDDLAADGTPKRGEDGKFLPKAAVAAKPAPAEATDEPKSKIALAIRAREEARKTVDTAKSDAESFMAEARRQAQVEAKQIVDDARKQAEADLSAWRAKLRSSPLQAIKDGGVDARTLVDEVTREGSPEWQAQKRLEAKLEATEAKLAKYDAILEKQEKDAIAFQEQERGRARKETEGRFIALIPEVSALRTLYDPSEILTKAHAMADEYREKTGEVASLEDLRDYLEEQAAKRLASIRQEKAVAPAAKKLANGPRTPSSSSASERRTSPKSYANLSPEEERDAMKQAAEDAMGAYAPKP